MLKKLLSLLGDAAVYGVSTLLSRVVGFLLIPVYVRYLGPTENGIMAMLMIVTMLFGPLANLGMSNAVYRRFNQAKDESGCRIVLGTGLLSVILGSLACLCVWMIFADWIARDFVGDASTTSLVRLALLTAAFNTIGQVPNVALRARRQVKTVVALNLLSVAVSIFTSILFVVGFEMGVKGWLLGLLAADTVFMVAAFACTWHMFDLKIDRATWKSMLSYGLPFVPHRLQAVALAEFSQYMVREMLGLDEAGIYAMAGKFALPVALIVGAIQESWIPFKFQMHAQEADARPYFRSIFTYYIAALTYLWVGVSLWGFEVVRLMTTPPFYAAAYLVPMLALLRASQGIYYMLGTGVELSDRTGVYPLISLAGLVTVVVGAFALVGPLGALGAALASVLCVWVMAAIVYTFAQRRLKIPYDWPTIGCFMLLASGCVAGAYAIQGWPLAMRLATYLGVSLAYPLVGFLLLIRSSAERDRMQILWLKFRSLRKPVGGVA